MTEPRQRMWSGKRSLWATTPDDARYVLVTALLMPLIMLSYQIPAAIMPLVGFEPWAVSFAARTTLNVSITFLVIIIVKQVQIQAEDSSRAVEARRQVLGINVDHSLLWNSGYSIEISSVALCGVTILMAVEANTIAWRMVTAANQTMLVLAWIVLWRLRRRWLSRQVAARASLVAVAGLAVYIVANLILPDPGVGGRGVVARTMLPIIEPALAVALYALVIPLWLKFYHRQVDAE